MTDPKPPSDRGEQQEQEKGYERTRYQLLLFVGGIALFGLVLGLVLDWYIDPKTSTEKKDLVQALGLITAGVAGAVGIYFTWRGQQQNRKAQEDNQRNTLAQLTNAEEQLSLSRQSQEDNQRNTQAQLEQNRNELQVNREGQITERFTRAIDQLGKVDDKGNKLIEIRLGGIYALERIARESEEDYWPIMEVLTAYVRQLAHWPEEERKALAAAAENRTRDLSSEIRAAMVSPPDPDIQAIMTIIRRRTRYYGHGEPEPLDLHGTNLTGANLRRADLTRAHLYEANLTGTILFEADLRGAWLEEANLTAVYLSKAHLCEAKLREAILFGADLRGAILLGADLTGADVSKAILSEAYDLTQEQLEKTRFGNEDTQLPPDLTPPEHWNVKTDE
jgi:hypothetical protein